MGLLDGRKGLVFGVANDRSIAFHIARNLVEHGATCGFAYLPGEKMERRVRKTLEDGGITSPWMFPCDVGKDEDLDRLFEAARAQFAPFLCGAFRSLRRPRVPPDGNFADTPRQFLPRPSTYPPIRW